MPSPPPLFGQLGCAENLAETKASAGEDWIDLPGRQFSNLRRWLMTVIVINYYDCIRIPLVLNARSIAKDHIRAVLL